MLSAHQDKKPEIRVVSTNEAITLLEQEAKRSAKILVKLSEYTLELVKTIANYRMK